MQTERDVGGMRCFEVLARLDAFVAGELVGEELGRLRAHVASCPNCAAFGGAYAQTLKALRTLGPSAEEAAAAARLRVRLAR